jgi:hypothetical protein
VEADVCHKLQCILLILTLGRIENKRKELDVPKQNSIYYLGNHRDLYNDIKLFYKFCLVRKNIIDALLMMAHTTTQRQSNRWTFETPAEDSRSKAKQGGFFLV